MERNTVHLQYFGKAYAKPAADFKSGELMMWNGGSRTKVLGVVEETKAFLTFQLECIDRTDLKLVKNPVHIRRLKKNRLVAIG